MVLCLYNQILLTLAILDSHNKRNFLGIITVYYIENTIKMSQF